MAKSGTQARASLILMGPGSVVRYALEAERTVLGRDDKADLRIDSPFISRAHAAVICHQDEYFVEDLESKNGTFVGGMPAGPTQPLRHRDELNLGPIRFIFWDDREQPSTLSYPGVRHVTADPVSRRVLVEGEPLPVTFSVLEIELVSFLTQDGVGVCSTNDVGSTLWGAGQFDPNMVHQLVRRVRKKLRDRAGIEGLIEAASGGGYRIGTVAQAPSPRDD